MGFLDDIFKDQPTLGDALRARQMQQAQHAFDAGRYYGMQAAQERIAEQQPADNLSQVRRVKHVDSIDVTEREKRKQLTEKAQ